MHHLLRKLLESFRAGSTAQSKGGRRPRVRLGLEALENRTLPSGFFPGLPPRPFPIPVLAHTNIAGKTVTFADSAGNAVGTLHVDSEDTSTGYFTGTFVNSAFHLKDNMGNPISVQVSGTVGLDISWTEVIGGGLVGPSVSFSGSASGTLSTFLVALPDVETVQFSGGLSSNAPGSPIMMGGTFSEHDLVTILGHQRDIPTPAQSLSGNLT
jgi:hypothetical protein